MQKKSIFINPQILSGSFPNIISLLMLLCIFLFVTGCGSDDSRVASHEDEETGGGYEGTGLIATGPIDAFGSIYVNGVHYNIDNADITINGEPATQADLTLGMYVRVGADQMGADGETVIATIVEYESYLIGPIERIILSQGGLYKIISVLNKSIIVNSDETFFSGTDYDSLKWVSG